MFAIGLILNIFGIGQFCWLVFTLAVYALPFFVGLTAGMAAFHDGAGIPAVFLLGLMAGALTLGIGRVAFAVVQSVALRTVIAAVFTVPAVVAGYHAVLGLSAIGVPSPFWRHVFACIGAIIIGGTAWIRMTVLAEPLSLQPRGQTLKPSPALLEGTP